VSNLDRLTFEKCALASGLLTEHQLDAARASMVGANGQAIDQSNPPSEDALASRLIDLGLLNAWQVKQLREGRSKFNLGPYWIVDSIGQGGMGHVFKARHANLNRLVAVKVLPRYKSTPEAIESFTREIRAAASLKHPKLVTALDAGQDGNVHYLVTEYVPGLDLRKWVRRDGPLNMAAAASIISQVAEGLQYAHDMGIVHRDVKPGNVLVTPQGEAKLSDLGLAESFANAANSPQYSKIVGTADYLSPDQVFNPGRPSPKWDIYSLGCTLYYAVTGKVPFPGGTTADKARAHCDLRPLDPRRLNMTLTDDFVDVMADMMAKDPEERIPTANEVIAKLKPFLTGQPSMEESSVTRPSSSQTDSLTAGIYSLSGTPPSNIPFEMFWMEAETQSDVSLLGPTQTEEDRVSDLNEPFDLKMLDEDIVTSVEKPLRLRRGWRQTFSPLTLLILSPFAVWLGVILLRWLIKWIWPG
jgi:serine/threonine protein kinase